MNVIRRFITITLFLLFSLAAANLWAGPPFQTDDPEPVEFRHYEVYVFGGSDGTPVETDPVGPAFEANWGAAPNLQLHIIMPLGAIVPSNNPLYSPAGVGPNAYGLTDTELGAKYRFVKETKHRPEFGTFTMLEIPTGSYAKGLGVGKVWYKLPVWVQKSWGHWTTYGGAGYQIVPADRVSQLHLWRMAVAKGHREKAYSRSRSLLARAGRACNTPDHVFDDG